MRQCRCRIATVVAVAVSALVVLAAAPAHGAPQTIHVPCGDVAKLRQAVTTANTTPDADTVVLGPGSPCTYTLTDAATTSPANGGNVTGLPVITAPLAIHGNNAMITRDSGAPAFRLVATFANLEIRDLVLHGGRLTGVDQSGGALAAIAASVLLNRTTIVANTVTGRDAGGGGVAALGGTLTVDSSSFGFNQATQGGAILVHRVGGAVERSTFFANRGTGSSGAALVLGSYDFENSTFTGNNARNGTGGITVAPSGALPGHADVVSSTFADNGATGSTAPGAAFTPVAAGAPATIEVADTIVTDTDSTATPVQPPCLEIFTGAAVVDQGGNILHPHDPGDACGFGTTADPRIGPLAANGGPTATHRLLPDSPAIDLGGGACPATDQRHDPRPEGEACDSGSFEADPPQTTAQGPATSPTGDPVVTFAADEPSTFECRVDGGDWHACTSPYRPAVADGEHTVDVRAIDSDGYVDATPASVTFVVDRPPDTTITGGPSGTTTQGTATFSFASDDPDATFECRLDGGPWTACTSPRSYSGYPPGSHTFSVRAVDATGQRDPTPASRTFTYRRCLLQLGQVICL